MGRPFTVIGLSMFASLFFICALGVTAAYVVLAVAVIALIIFVSIKKLRRNVAIIVSLAAVIFAGGLYVGTYHFAYLPSEQYFGKEASVSGTLKDYPDYEYHRYYAEIKVKTIGGNEVRPFVMRISFPDYIEAQPGDTLTCKAVISESGTASRFSKLNYLSKGVFASAYCADEPVVEENTDAWKGLSVYLAQYRHFICENLRNVLPKSHAALASAVLIGEKSYIDSDTLTNINNAGISHIICVSGLHLSIIAAALLKLFTALKVSRKLKYISCAGFIIFFMALCGFTSSVVRAGMMFLVYIAAELMLAEPDSLNSLGLAAFVILLNPFNAGNIGFIFSFSATLAIILCGSRVIDYLKEKWEISECSKVKKCLFSLLEIVIISVFVNAFCMPFSILIFQKFSLISIIANVFILPFASMLLISCALCALFAMLPLSVFGFIIYPVAAFASLMCAYTLKVVDILAGIPFSNVYAGSAPLLCACACVLL
ncbi:MAG: ComEC/Rec2 family competence protein [Clostridia bacterium]|nr:ComEC/Rec2 family competence protein [Clostridia bacterium]